MRYYLTIALFLTSIFGLSQTRNSYEHATADSGKQEFKDQSQKDTADYSKAFRMLSNQVRQNPQNAEYRYFLGYAIDRINAEDGKGMLQLQKELTMRASEQFEEVNKLEPIYKGEIFILDPYSKLTSIWGCLAESYLTRKLIDSAKWAFLEGKKRGGFIEPVLEFNRQLLNSCEKKAILISYGDNLTIPIWYLQTIENLRTDITVVDANLLNTNWYPKYLKHERDLKISLSDTVIDTLEYEQWESKEITITNSTNPMQTFTWELRPTYINSYILKGDKILLNIFQQNLFQRPMYFAGNSDSTYNLFLTPYIVDQGTVTKVIPHKIDWNSNILTIPENLKHYNIDKLKKEDILKSRDAILLLNDFRWCYYNIIFHMLKKSKHSEAQELIKMMYEKFKKDKLPFSSNEAEQYFLELFKKVEKKESL